MSYVQEKKFSFYSLFLIGVVSGFILCKSSFAGDTIAEGDNLPAKMAMSSKSSDGIAGFEYHLALEVLPLMKTANNPAGAGLGLVFENWHHSRELISLIGVEVSQDYGNHYRTDFDATFGLLARVVENIYVGTRLGVVTNNPNSPVAFGALAVRALLPITPQPGLFGALFTEADLGVSGSGHQYGAVRFGLKIL